MTKVLSILALLFALVGPAHAITPESGWWWNPNASGTGYNIEIQDNVLAVATYVFDASGAPTYYISAGAMSNDSSYSGTLNLYTGGQCVGCAYKAPSGASAGTITIKFTSAQQGTLTMNGGSPIPIQRFSFGVNTAAPYAMLGEWSTTTGTKLYPVYFGDRIQFPSVKTSTAAGSSGVLYASGNRTGDYVATAVALQDKGVWAMMVDSSPSYYTYYEFTFTGLNSIEGSSWTYLKTSNPSGSGLPFIAYRSQSAALVKTGVGPGARALEVSPKQRIQALADAERRDEQLYLSADRDSVNTDAAFSGRVAQVMAAVRELQQAPQQ